MKRTDAAGEIIHVGDLSEYMIMGGQNDPCGTGSL